MSLKSKKITALKEKCFALLPVELVLLLGLTDPAKHQWVWVIRTIVMGYQVNPDKVKIVHLTFLKKYVKWKS